jgi:hypothetical protein
MHSISYALRCDVMMWGVMLHGGGRGVPKGWAVHVWQTGLTHRRDERGDFLNIRELQLLICRNRAAGLMAQVFHLRSAVQGR